MTNDAKIIRIGSKGNRYLIDAIVIICIKVNKKIVIKSGDICLKYFLE